MLVERIVLFGVLGAVLSVLGIETWSTQWWCFVGLYLANGWASYSAGHDDATDLAQDTWHKAKRTLEEAIAREDKVQRLIKEHKDTL